MRTQGPSVLRLSVCLAIAGLALNAPGVQGRLETKLVRRDFGHLQQPRWFEAAPGAHQLDRRQGITIGGGDDANSSDDASSQDGNNNSSEAQDASSAADDADATTSSSPQEDATSSATETSSSDDSIEIPTSTTSSSSESSEDQPTSTSSSSSQDDQDSSSSESQSVAVKPSTVSNSEGVSVIDVTSTLQPSESASAASDKDSDDDGGGLSLGKKALIIIISVASAVALVAAVWTILRKWKFSPSKRFENRLNPIDWQPEPDDQVKLPNNDAASLHRADSYGSNTGSMRGGAMSERGDAFSHITGGYARQAPSAVGSNYGAAPAYPPGFNPAAYNQSQQSYPDYHRPYAPSPAPQLANPYDQISRQNTVMSTSTGGGRYGEGYGQRTQY